MPRRASLNHSSVLPPWCSCSPTGSHGPSKISPRRVAPHPQSLRLLTIAALEDGNWLVLGETPSICAAPSSFLTFGIPSLTCSSTILMEPSRSCNDRRVFVDLGSTITQETMLTCCYHGIRGGTLSLFSPSCSTPMVGWNYGAFGEGGVRLLLQMLRQPHIFKPHQTKRTRIHYLYYGF